MNYVPAFILLYILLFTLQLAGIMFYTNDCTFVEPFNIRFDDLMTYIMYGHGVISILMAPLALKYYEKHIYKIWLFVNILIGMFYFATGITIYTRNDATTCQNTGIGLICSGGVQYIACIVSLIVEIFKYFKSDDTDEIIQNRNEELGEIIRNPHGSFSRDSVVRDKEGSLLSINLS